MGLVLGSRSKGIILGVEVWFFLWVYNLTHISLSY